MFRSSSSKPICGRSDYQSSTGRMDVLLSPDYCSGGGGSSKAVILIAFGIVGLVILVGIGLVLMFTFGPWKDLLRQRKVHRSNLYVEHYNIDA